MKRVDPHVPEVFAEFAYAVGCLTGSVFAILCRDWLVVATFVALVLWTGRKLVLYRRIR